jgi:hypothetical protein
VYFDVESALNKASLAVLLIAMFTSTYLATTLENQALLALPLLHILSNKTPAFLQDMVPLCAFSVGLLAMHVAQINE